MPNDVRLSADRFPVGRESLGAFVKLWAETMNVLLVEDDVELRDALSRVLASRGLRLVCCSCSMEGLNMAGRHHFDALVLDLTRPSLDGLKGLQRLLLGEIQVPVLIVTARPLGGKRVFALEAGGNDYLSQPLDVEALAMRVKTLICRGQCDEDLRCGDLWLEAQTGIFYSGTRPMDVSPRESSLLKALMQRHGKAVAKEVLRDAVFGPDAVESADAIEVLVHRLRKRLSNASVELVTLRGLGYLLMDQVSDGKEFGV